MSSTLRARFVVHSVTEWGELRLRQYFLKYLLAEWDEDAEDGDPVAELLYEVRSDAIPSDFEFTHRDRDARPGRLFGEEGIKIEIVSDKVKLATGDIVDMELRVVGRVGFGQ